MNRFQKAVFLVLALATVGAFYLTQHIKVLTPFINGGPRPDPAAIDPIAGGVCVNRVGKLSSFRATRIGFYLQNSSDTVDVYVVNSSGQVVATAGGSGRYMRATLALHAREDYFTWNGRESGGGLAPPGTYYFKIVLESRDRQIILSKEPVKLLLTPPVPRVLQVTAVSAGAGSAAGVTPAASSGEPPGVPRGPVGSATARGAVITPPGQQVLIRWRRAHYIRARILIYRAGATRAQPLTLVKSFRVAGSAGRGVWDGRIGGRLAPAGTYLIGMRVLDAACTPGTWPAVNPPPPGTTAGAGVSVRYLAATPPLTPVPAGSLAAVGVYDGGSAYRWTLRRSDGTRVIFHGTEPAAATRMLVRIPDYPAGLYTLTLATPHATSTVPLAAQTAGPASAADRVLVVLPALSWQGANPVDDSGTGLPATLATGDRISLDRPLVAGLPADWPDEAGLLAYLDRNRVRYQLTTDIALAEGVGPQLRGHTGVILDGTFSWLPASLVGSLASYASAGGRVLSLGIGSLQHTARVLAGAGGTSAGDPQALSPDPFGARHGELSGTGGQLITVIADHLKVFGQAVAFSGYPAYQAIFQPSGPVGSVAGVAASAPAISAFRVGSGTVIEVGLPHFGASLRANVAGQELMAGALRELTG